MTGVLPDLYFFQYPIFLQIKCYYFIWLPQYLSLISPGLQKVDSS